MAAPPVFAPLAVSNPSRFHRPAFPPLLVPGKILAFSPLVSPLRAAKTFFYHRSTVLFLVPSARSLICVPLPSGTSYCYAFRQSLRVQKSSSFFLLSRLIAPCLPFYSLFGEGFTLMGRPPPLLAVLSRLSLRARVPLLFLSYLS